MFRQRLITALVLIPLVLFGIFYASSWVFSALILLLLLGCALEWFQLIPLNQLASKALFLLALFGVAYLMTYELHYWLYAGLIVWGLILFAVLGFPSSQSIWGYRSIVIALGLFLLPLFAHSMLGVYQYQQGKALVVYILFLVWAADVGAYFAGKLLGMHKLIPAVSPGKTVEGLLGGFSLSMLTAFAGYYYFKPEHCFKWFLLAILTTLISMLGDLFISMLKRRVKIKDTGTIFPGHGGALDRLDSLIAALPLFYCGLSLLAPG